MMRRARALIIGLALLLVTGAVLLLSRLVIPLEIIARGWLVGFAVCSGAPVGSLVLLMIHRLTGGAWGTSLAPVLRPAAATLPLVALAFLPIAFALPAVYPWAADPGLVPPDVAHWYLNGPSFLARAAITLIGWSLLGLAMAIGVGGRLLAALGLAFYGLTISLVAVDWFLSIEPHYTATAFAAMIAIQQMLTALAVAAVVGTRHLGAKTTGDLGALLLATLLGVVYLELMTFVVAWYGDLPDKAAWFLKRGATGWAATLVVAVLAGALLPFGMLLVRAVRTSPFGLRIAGALILVGVGLHVAWLLVPAFDGALGPVLVGLASGGALALVWLAFGAALRSGEEAVHAG